MPRFAAKYPVEGPSSDNRAEDVVLATDTGNIRCRLHRARTGDAGVVYVFGAGGGLGGPAGGVYERIARMFQGRGVTSLEADYRRPGDLRRCVEDVVMAAEFLESAGAARIVLVGHSFGGAVVINAGISLPVVVGVAALSSQTFGAEGVARLSPRPLLLIHGEDDEVLRWRVP